MFSWPALVAWLGSLIVLFLPQIGALPRMGWLLTGPFGAVIGLIPAGLFFKWLPGWFLAAIVYILLSALAGERETATAQE